MSSPFTIHNGLLCDDVNSAITCTVPFIADGGQLSPSGDYPVGGTHVFVDTVNGVNSGSGTSGGPWSTVAYALSQASSGDVIHVQGDIREQVEAPVGLYGVTIVGNDTTPRHATSGGVVVPGNGVSWRAPASPTAATPLLRLREQGWVIKNILFVPPSDAAAIELRRREDAADPDASHAKILGCRFAGGLTGIEDNGGCHNVLIAGCIFQDQTDSAIETTSTTIAVPLANYIVGCYFRSCAHGIRVSYSNGVIRGNLFRSITTTELSTIHVSAQGSENYVVENYFEQNEADITVANGYVGAATDVWRNYSANTAAQTVGVPS